MPRTTQKIIVVCSCGTKMLATTTEHNLKQGSYDWANIYGRHVMLKFEKFDIHRGMDVYSVAGCRMEHRHFVEGAAE